MYNRYLEEDPSTTVLERRRRLHGYELYIVEQWACSRVHPTFVITTYTGLEQHSVLVSVLSVPTNENAWSPRLRVYLKATNKYHARKKETSLGTLMVTNLSGFPSALTVIAVPDGDVKKHRVDFILNEDLKRLGCSGRAALKLTTPIGPTQAKFNRLYKTSDRVPIHSAVIELVKLCQTALMLFGKLAPEYADGLLCDVTEQAINDWWTDLGTEFFNIDPSDGILGPTTVAALLGLLLGARNRLSAYGAPVGKDAFDVTSMKRGIGSFQKSREIVRTRRLDRQTLAQLHKASAKAASSQGWQVPRAVKSTVAELSGKGGDVVLSMVGARDRAGIAEIETLDIDSFAQLVYGERCKWIWHGKPRKNHTKEIFNDLEGYEDGLVFSNDDHGGYKWASTRKQSTYEDISNYGLTDRVYTMPSHESQIVSESADKDQALRRNVFKTVTGRITDARTGLGRIKEAVGKTGLRNHHPKYSKDGNIASDGDGTKGVVIENQINSSATDLDSWLSPSESVPGNAEEEVSGQWLHSRRDSSIPDDSEEVRESAKILASNDKAIETDAESISSLDSNLRDMRLEDHRLSRSVPSQRKSTVSIGSLKAIDPQRASDLPSKSLEKIRGFHSQSETPLVLRTNRSLSHLPRKSLETSYGDRWPRHLSFSAVVDVLSIKDDLGAGSEDKDQDEPDVALLVENVMLLKSRLLEARLYKLRNETSAWVEEGIDHINNFNSQAVRDQESLDSMYHEKLREYHALRDASDKLLAEEKNSLTESAKDLDNLGAKLEYELSALRSKVEDVESGIVEFERQVVQVEKRAEELHDGSTEDCSWFSWATRIFRR